MGFVKAPCEELDNSICFDSNISEDSKEDEKNYINQFLNFELPKRSDKKAKFIKIQENQLIETPDADDIPFSELDFESPEVHRKANIETKFHNSVRVTHGKKARLIETHSPDNKLDIPQRPSRSIGSSKHLEITDLFANNVISERVRKYPRELESQHYNTKSTNLKLFEAVPETISEESNDECNVEEEEEDYTTQINDTRAMKVKGQKDSNSSMDTHNKSFPLHEFSLLTKVVDTPSIEEIKEETKPIDTGFDDTFEVPDAQVEDFDSSLKSISVAHQVRESKVKMRSPRNSNKTKSPTSPELTKFCLSKRERKTRKNKVYTDQDGSNEEDEAY